MAKTLSIAIIVLAILAGGGAIYLKTNMPVPARELPKAVSDTSPSTESFADIASTSTVAPTPVSQETAVLGTTIEPTATPAPVRKGPYPMEIDPKKAYEATLETSKGAITIKLNAAAMPKTVNNFVSLSRRKFYDNTIFHRVIKGFMIQGGDPKGNGTGGPGYTFEDEPFEGDYTRGVVAMANAGPNTNGSQFFIMHASVGLPKNYVIFGSVVSGMDVVDAIAQSPTKPEGEGSTPVTPTTVKTVSITER